MVFLSQQTIFFISETKQFFPLIVDPNKIGLPSAKQKTNTIPGADLGMGGGGGAPGAPPPVQSHNDN